MNISKQVIVDLLPLYASGEASKETCQLVQHFVDTDPEIRKLLKDMVKAEELLTIKPPVPDLADAQLLSLRKARLLIRYRSVIMGAAIAYSLFPLSFVFSNGQMHWIIIEGMPKVAVFSVVVALALWFAWVFLFQKARRIGL